MQKHKLIQNASSGTHYYMPSLTRSLEKLVRVIDHEMNNIDAQKVVLPCLSPEVLWEKSGRRIYFALLQRFHSIVVVKIITLAL